MVDRCVVLSHILSPSLSSSVDRLYLHRHVPLAYYDSNLDAGETLDYRSGDLVSVERWDVDGLIISSCVVCEIYNAKKNHRGRKKRDLANAQHKFAVDSACYVCQDDMYALSASFCS